MLIKNEKTEIINSYQFSADNGVESLHALLLERCQTSSFSKEDIQYLLLLEFNNQEKAKKLRLAVYLHGDANIQNGRVLGLIAIAAIGFFLLPALIGVSPLVGLLIGAAIGWKVLGFSKKPMTNQQQKKESIVSAPGFDSAPQPPQIGGTIPLIFTNKQVNPNGGVRVNGNFINGYIQTIKNEQILYTLSALGLGTIEQISETALLIDNQPRYNFFEDEIQTQYTLGTKDQTRFAEFPFYSQAITPSNNNTVGMSFKALANANSLNGNVFTVSEDDFDIFSPSEKYRVNGISFRVTNKSISNFQLFCNKNLNDLGDRRIYSEYLAIYETSKRCTRIDLNFAFDVWARNDKNALIKSAIAFVLVVDGVSIANFYVLNSKEGTVRRSITIKNLPLQKHTILLIPNTGIDSNYVSYRLDDSGIVRTLDTSFVFSGRTMQLVIESDPNNQGNNSTINEALRTDNKAQNSSDRGANGKLSSVNEIVYPTDIGQTQMINYGKLIIAKNIAKASNRLNGAPAYSHSITKGLIGKSHLSAGEASIGSANAALVANGIDLSEAYVGAMCRNLTRGVESTITSISGATVQTQFSLNWTQGDNFLIFVNGAINYFPDIFVWTLTVKEGGLGNVVNERFINFPSICNARKFCKSNNLYWDGVIESAIGWDEWVNQESLTALLYPSKYAGNYGLKPETYTQPTDIFNASRILPGTFNQSKPDSKLINAVQLTYKSEIDGKKYDKTLTVVTADVYYGRQAFEPITLNFPAITNEEQAKKVAARTLKSRIIQNKVTTFSTGIAGFHVQEGDLVIIQYSLTEKESEVSGFALVVQTFMSGGVQEVQLSRKITLPLDSSYKANVYHLESGTVEMDKSFSLLANGNILLSGLSEPVKPARENFNADIIIICKNVTEKLFRVASIKPKDYSVELSCINWSTDILNYDNLFFIS